MSFDTRNHSALSKRAEQLKRWEESDTNLEPALPKNLASRRIKFSSGCVFLAACMSGDKEEVLRLLESGADIDTANVDGLTALHQACIDDNLDMVEFLVNAGSDINRQDNEGWTPLHATASCGFVSIARFLVENGANLAAVNSDGELPLDLAESDHMESLLRKHIHEQRIDCEEARQSEERLMLNDAKNWLRSDASEADKPHPRTGATALHVAAAKGYTKVLSLLLATRADVDKQDNDGWTPLHAASHWGQKEAAQMLVAALADLDIKNYAGQTPLDVVDPSILRFLEDLKKNNKRTKRRPASQIRISDNMDNHIEAPTRVIRVEVKPDIDGDTIEFVEENVFESEHESDTNSNDTESTESSHSTSISESGIDEKPKVPTESVAQLSKDVNSVAEDDAPWRRTGSLRNRIQQESPTKPQVPEKDVTQTPESEVILRRTQSFESDDKFYQKYNELRARIKANSCPVLPATPAGGVIGVNNTTNSYSVQRSASLKDHRQLRKTGLPPIVASPTAPATTTTTTSGQVRSLPGLPLASAKLGNVTNLAQNYIAQNNIGASSSRPTIIGGSAINLNTITDTASSRPRHASSVNDLANDDNNAPLTGSNNNSNNQSTNNDNTNNINSTQLLNDLKTIKNNNESATIRSKFTPGNIFKNFFKSFVPPVRDEESETQRKAHAKRVRETRRSTQGVTLDEIKSAEELVKKINLNNNNNTSNNNSEIPTTTTTTTTNATATPSSITSSSTIHNDRVPALKSGDSESAVPQDSSSSSSSSVISKASDQIVATYTISAPPISNKSDVNDKIIASYTIPPPASTTMSASQAVGKGLTNKPNERRESIESPSISATISVSSPPTTKTDLETLTKTALPTIAHAVIKLDKNNSGAPSQSLEDGEKTANVTVVPVPYAQEKPDTPTVDFTFSKTRDKRSLFDIDNASSLSLADKLRNEANKYSEASRSNSDVSSIGLHKNAAIEAETERKYGSTPSSPMHHGNAAERRPSWRLKFDAGCKFKLEDAAPSANTTNNTSNNSTSATTGYSANAQKRPSTINSSSSNNNQRPVSAPVISGSNTDLSNDRIKDNSTSADVTLSLRRPKSSSEDKENDKENDSRSAQATQAVIQRRRRPKRRSTGVVHVDMDDIDPDRQDADGDDKESGSERASRSRLGSTSSLTSEPNAETAKSSSADLTENGEHIDYKALYEAAKVDNERLRLQLKKKEEDLLNAKAAVDRFANATTKNSLSELEKRERRAMERKLSEMEEELKNYDVLKTENQRLKDENGALIRVISKLSK